MYRRALRRIAVVLGLAAGGCSSLSGREGPQAQVWDTAAEAQVIEALEAAHAAAETLQGYTCRFYRHERVGGYLGARQQMEVKFRRRPFSLYLRWVGPARAGAEFLYVAGRYEDKAFARPGGPVGWFVRTARLRLDDPLIVEGSRHPVTRFGVESATKMLLESVRRAQGVSGFRARRLGSGEVHGEPARGFEMVLPDGHEFYARRVRVWFDPATQLLKGFEAYGDADELLEDYAFTRLRPNVRFTDADFNPDNPAYGF